MKTFPVLHLIALAALITVTSLSVIHTTAQSAAGLTTKINRKTLNTAKFDTTNIQIYNTHIK